MISNVALETSIGVVSENNRCLKAMDGTPLAIATSALNDSVLFALSGHSDRTQPFSFDELVNCISNCSQDDTNVHQNVIDELVTKVTNITRNNIYVARNVVLPLVDEYTERLNGLVNEFAHAPNLAMRVVTDNKKNILNSDVLLNAVSKYENYLGRAETVSCHAEMSLMDLEVCLKTGVTALDKLIEEWYGSNDLSGKLKETYTNVFLSGTARPLSDFVNHVNYETAIFTLLLAKHFLRETPEGVNLSAKNYDLKLTEVEATAARSIATAIKDHNRNLEQGHLVNMYPVGGLQYQFEKTHTGSNDIFVNASVYNSFLEKGGTPEMVVGAYLSDRKTRADAILENADAYKRVYDRAIHTGKLTKLNKMLTVVKTSLNTFGGSVIDDIKSKVNSDDSSEYTGINFDNTLFGRKIVEFTNRITVDDMDNLYTLVRNYICDIFFEQSSVGDLLRRIDKLDPNGESNINDVAIIVSADFVVDWLMSQVTVGKANEMS